MIKKYVQQQNKFHKLKDSSQKSAHCKTWVQTAYQEELEYLQKEKNELLKRMTDQEAIFKQINYNYEKDIKNVGVTLQHDVKECKKVEIQEKYSKLLKEQILET